MAKLQNFRPRVTCEAVITLNLEEMRALAALTCYGIDPLIKVFYEKMGVSALKPHEEGLRSFLAAAASVSLSPVNEAERALRDHWIEKAKASALSETQDEGDGRC